MADTWYKFGSLTLDKSATNNQLPNQKHLGTLTKANPGN